MLGAWSSTRHRGGVTRNTAEERRYGAVAAVVLLFFVAGGVAVLRSQSNVAPGAPAPNRRALAVCGRATSDVVSTAAGDFDGDRRVDHIYERQRDSQSWVLGICLHDGRSEEVDLGAALPEGAFGAEDLNGDGRTEVIFGGTSASQGLDVLMVFLDGHLTDVAGPVLASGPLSQDDAQSWGCSDPDHDGRREIVQVTLRRQGATASWTKEFYQLDRAAMTKVATKTGAQRTNGYVWEQADSLVRPC